MNQLASGACGLNDGSKTGDWRLPNLNELESLVDVSQANPALPAGNLFTNVSDAIYWSSTSYFGGQGGSPTAWALRMNDGRYMNDYVSNIKATSNNEVWAVKGIGGGAIDLQGTGQYVTYAKGDDGSIQAGVPPTFQRWVDKGDGTIIDTVTGLIWLKKADCIHTDWTNAVAAVNSLASGQCGLTDGSAADTWRMPNRNELLSLSDRQENNDGAFFDATYLNMDGTLFRPPIFTNYLRINTTGPQRLMPRIQAKHGPYSVAITESMTYPKPIWLTRLRCDDSRLRDRHCRDYAWELSPSEASCRSEAPEGRPLWGKTSWRTIERPSCNSAKLSRAVT